MSYWYDSSIFYHIYPLGFCGAPFRNPYDAPVFRLEKLREWVPHIKDLGCNALYLGPIFQSMTHGYDTVDYRMVDNRLGNNESLAGLIAHLQANGLRVVLDAVYNHCGRDFFAFQDLRAKGEASAYRHWFAGVDFSRPSPLGDPFTYETWGGHYELVKFNLQHPEVKDYLLQATRFWQEAFNPDGLRLDAADCLDINFLQELRQITTSQRADFWLLGEVLHGDYTRWANPQALHSVTNYEAYKGLYSSHNDRNLFEIASTLERQFSSQTGRYSQLKLYNFVDNHDVNRLASTVKNPAYLYTIYLLLFTIPGLPSIYYGSEWGVQGAKVNNSDALLRPHLDLNNIPTTEPDLPKAIKKFAQLRSNSPALQNGSYRRIMLEYQKPLVFERATPDERLLIIINPEGTPKADAGPTTVPQKTEINLKNERGNYFDLLNNEYIKETRLQKLEIYHHWGRVLKQV